MNKINEKKIISLSLYFFVFSCLFLVSGCEQKIDILDNAIEIEASINTNKSYETEWQTLETGAYFKEEPIYANISQGDVLQDVVTVFKFDPEHFNFSLKQNIKQPLTVSEWKDKLDPLFVCNGGYFMENYEPSAYFKIKGKTFGSNLTSASVGEIVFDDEKLKIFTEIDLNKYNNILQSYPLLVTPDKANVIEEDSGQTAPRTVIAKDKEDNVLFIFTQNYYFSLYKLQNFLIDSDLNLKIALNLDGGTSNGYYFNGEYKKISESVEVPNVVAVFRK